jgi:tRNA threonylcarbamoyladenosine biosynthesis protein TsaE
VIELPAAADTRALGKALAALTRAGDLVILAGDLGAGKTTLVQGLGEGLNVRGQITSPTFVIARYHPPLGPGPGLTHVDAYRLGGLDQLDDLDLDAEMADSVTAVEWGLGLAERLATDHLIVHLERQRGASQNRRIARLEATGERWRGVELPG